MSEKTPRKRGCRYFLNLLVVAIILACFGLYVVIPVYITHSFLHPPPTSVVDTSPAEYDLNVEEVELVTKDELKLSGWYIASRNGAAVIAVHGYGSNRAAVLPHAALLAQHGYGVLLFDLRAHGKSEGEVFPFGWDADQDIFAALDYLETRPDVDPERIGALGLSIGGEIVMQSAAEDERIKALVSEGAGFRTLGDMFLVPGLVNLARAPGVWVMMNTGHLISGVAPPPSTPDLLRQIAPRPLFLISADLPEERLPNHAYFESAGEPKTLWEAPKTGHIAALSTHPEEYEEKVIGFFDEALLGSTPSDLEPTDEH